MKNNNLIIKKFNKFNKIFNLPYFYLYDQILNDKDVNNMWKDEDGKVYIEEDLFNEALEECHSEESAYEYIDNLINEMELKEI